MGIRGRINAGKFSLVLTAVFFIVGASALIYFFFGDSEIRAYNFQYEDRPEDVVLVLRAPHGFQTGNKVVVEDIKLRFDERKVSESEYVDISVLSGGMQIVGSGSPSGGLEVIEVKSDEDSSRVNSPATYISKGGTFSLSQGGKLRSIFAYKENGSVEKKYSERKDLEVGDSDEIKFFLGLLALLGLCFSMFSGIRDMSEVLEN